MSLARLVITAIYVEGRNKSEVAREYRVSRRWVQKLTARYAAEGEAAFEPRSRRPRTSPRRVSRELEDQIVALRKTLGEEGLDAGAATIAVHLTRLNGSAPAVSTIWRVLTRRGFVTPQPRKRPKASYVRFQADQPNERWQLDITHWQLAGGTGAEILNIIDDHSRLLTASAARLVFKAADVVTVFRQAASQHGLPASMLPATARSSPAGPAATGKSPWKSSSPPCTSPSGTPAPTTPRPAAKSSGSIRHSRNGSPASPPPRRSPACRPSSTGSPATTTTSAPTGPLAAAPPPPRSPPAPQRAQPGSPPTPTTASATTASTTAASSPSATTAASTTSASAAPTPAPASWPSSPTSTSASSTATPANYSAPSPSIRQRTTSHSPEKRTMSRDTCDRCPETSQWRWRWDLNPRKGCPFTRFRGVRPRPLGDSTAAEPTRPGQPAPAPPCLAQGQPGRPSPEFLSRSKKSCSSPAHSLASTPSITSTSGPSLRSCSTSQSEPAAPAWGSTAP